MPRIQVWLSGALVAGALYIYALPTLNQEVNQYIETRETSVLTGEQARARDQALRVHQLYASLVGTVENAHALAVEMGLPTSGPGAASPPSEATSSTSLRTVDQWRSQSVLKTNKDILLFYCDIQRLRSLLLRVPTRAQTAEEKLRLWRAADALEAQQCGTTTVLNFREAPLCWSEWCRSVYSFVCYVVFFRLLPFVWCSDSDSRRRVMHAAAQHITGVLEIDCEMTLGMAFAMEKVHEEERQHPHATYDSSAWFDEANKDVATTGPTAAAAAPPTEYMLLNAQHWVEEVGFWACAPNPLLPSRHATTATSPVPAPVVPRRQLLSGRSDLGRCLDAWRATWAGALADQGRRRSGRQTLWTHQHGLCGAWLLYARPSRSATAESIPYELHWCAFFNTPAHSAGGGGDNEGAVPSTDSPLAALVLAVRQRAVTSALGYPLLSDTTEVRRQLHRPAAAPQTTSAHEDEDRFTETGRAGRTDDTLHSAPVHAPSVKVVPIGLAGLPRLLYVNAQTARPDVAPKRTRNQMYDYVYQKQYARNPRRQGGDGSAETDAESDADARRLTRAERRTVQTLHSVRVHGGFHWWSPLWWGRVYGGQSQRGQPTRRVLRYHVGGPCTVDTYDLEQLDATVKATAEAYATS